MRNQTNKAFDTININRRMLMRLKKLISSIMIAAMTVSSLGMGVMATDKAVYGDTKAPVTLKGTYGQTEARKMLSRVNAFRTSGSAWYWNEDDTTKSVLSDLKAYSYDYELERIAMKRVVEIAYSYSHTRPNGESCFTAFAFDSGARGENIAYGKATEAEAFEFWKEEDYKFDHQSHRRNMLGSNFNYIGIAHFVYNGIHFWVQELSENPCDSKVTDVNDSEVEATIDFSPSQNSSDNTSKENTEKSTVPPKVSFKSLKAKGKTVTAKWDRNSNADGYQVQYATDKKMTAKVKTKNLSASKNGLKVKYATKNKKYYFRIRSFVKTGNGKKYSKWSKVKAVKIK